MGALPLTGERTVPGIAHENYWFRRHEAAYLFARTLLAGEQPGPVLEVGCGEGYGTALLASGGHRVIGVDYDAATVGHAARRYRRPRFVRGNLAALPVRDAAVSALVTLQVIEHVWDHAQFVRECVRVSRPGGLVLVTTPNRLTFSPGRDTPVNPFHTHEFTVAELIGLLTAQGLRVERVAGLHAGPALRALDAGHGGSFVDAQLARPAPEWDGRLRRDVAAVRTDDFVVLPAEAGDPGVSLDLVVTARRGR